jgi:outer membrane immunogenic protein
MKLFLLAMIASAGLTASGQAADMPVKVPPAITAVPNWTGFYIGVNAGGASADFKRDYFLPGRVLDIGHDGQSGFVGGRIGYNYQLPSRFVLGIEAEFNAGKISGSRVCPNTALRCSSSIDWFGSVTGRLGYAVDRVLLFADGGVAFGTRKYRVSGPCAFSLNCGPLDDDSVGWAAGGGIEFAVTPSVILSVEYKHYDFPTKSAGFAVLDAGPLGVEVSTKVDTVRGGLAYKF